MSPRLLTVGAFGVAMLGAAMSTDPAGAAQPGRVADNPAGPLSSIARLAGVDAVSADDGWAVGETKADGAASTLIEHWNGTSWQQVAGPNPGGLFGTTLTGVTAVSANDVWAVGSYGVLLKGRRSLVLHWNGATWSQVSSPNPGGSGENRLLAVSAFASDDVWAVGWHTSTALPAVTLVEHWDGARWSVVPSPNPSHHVGNVRSGVSALSDRDVWAVGSFSQHGGTRSTLVSRWNGRRWSRPSSPIPGTLGNELLGVSARASKDVWAVGDASSVPTASAALIERWNGRRWSVVPGPDLDGANSALLSVSADAKKDVWAVGYVGEGGARQTLTAHWDGVTWTLVPSPSPGAFGNTLNGVLAGGPTSAWAVGSAFTSAVEAEPMITGWDGEQWLMY